MLDSSPEALAFLMWCKDGNLACDTCGTVYEYDGPRVMVLNAARSRGWHLFQGSSLTGKSLDSHLCPQCVGTARSATIKTERLEEEEPLF